MLADLEHNYEDAVGAARDAAISTSHASLSTFQGDIEQIPNIVSQYIVSNSIHSNFDSSTFRNLVTSFQTNVQTVMNNATNQALLGYRTRSNNAQIDFNVAISDAGSAFSDALNAVVITDTTYGDKYTAVKAELDIFVSDASTQVSSRFSADDQTTVDLQSGLNSKVSDLVKSHVFDRPLVRNAGNFRYPSAPKVGGLNDFSVDLTNIGNKTWVGWIGIKVTDEFNKKYTDNGLVSLTRIDPGQTFTLKRSLKIPVKLPTKSGSMLNTGKTLKFSFMINMQT